MADGDVRPVLITRPTEDSRPLAATSVRAGGQPILEPLLTIGYLDEKLDLDNIQGIIFTSANGVRAYIRLTPRRDHPIYAVGPASAREAETAGFKEIHIAAGDVESLAEMIQAKAKPKDGAFLHAAGSKLAGDLSGDLQTHGYEIRRAVLYDAGKADRLSQNAIDAIKSTQGCIIPLFSPRTAETLLALVRDAGVSSHLGKCTALCLSQAVADKLTDSDWGHIQVTDRPEQELMLTALESILTGEDGSGSMTEDSAKNENQTDMDDATLADINTEALIEAFGGIRPMAHKLDIAVSTVQGWKMRNHIPDARMEDIQRAAVENGIDLSQISTLEVAEETAAQDIPEGPQEQQEEAPKQETAPAKASEAVAPAPEPQVIVKRGGSSVAWLALLLSLGMGGALITQPYWSKSVEDALHPTLAKFAPNFFAEKEDAAGAQSAALDGLRGQLADLSDRLGGFASRLEESSDNQPDLGKLTERLQDLEQQLASLEISRPVSAIAGATENLDLGPVNQRLGELTRLFQEGRKAGLDGQAALQEAVTSQSEQTASVAAQLTALQTRLQAAESQLQKFKSSPAQRDSREVALVIAVGQLESQLVAGQSYYRSLLTLEALSKDIPDVAGPIKTLSANADQGVVTRAALAREFEAMVRQLRDPVQDASWENWIDTSLANVKNLVSIRPTGSAEDLPPESLAENALAHDDLEGAIAALTSLEGTHASIDDWLQSANARIRAELALADLRRIAVHRLALASTSLDPAEMIKTEEPAAAAVAPVTEAPATAEETTSQPEGESQ